MLSFKPTYYNYVIVTNIIILIRIYLKNKENNVKIKEHEKHIRHTEKYRTYYNWSPSRINEKGTYTVFDKIVHGTF